MIPLCARGLNWAHAALGMVRDGNKWGMVRPRGYTGVPLATMDQEHDLGPKNVILS